MATNAETVRQQVEDFKSVVPLVQVRSGCGVTSGAVLVAGHDDEALGNLCTQTVSPRLLAFDLSANRHPMYKL